MYNYGDKDKLALFLGKMSKIFIVLETVSYASRAFAVAEDTTEGMSGSRRQGTWADSEMEKALKSILSFARSHASKTPLIL